MVTVASLWPTRYGWLLPMSVWPAFDGNCSDTAAPFWSRPETITSPPSQPGPNVTVARNGVSGPRNGSDGVDVKSGNPFDGESPRYGSWSGVDEANVQL